MAAQDQSAAGTRGTGDGPGDTYCVAGSLTITRAASTARELESLSDPLTIDLSKVEKMDTVGAWIVYRTVRDRGANPFGERPLGRQFDIELPVQHLPLRLGIGTDVARHDVPHQPRRNQLADAKQRADSSHAP